MTIQLPETEKLLAPHPKPYKGIEVTLEELKFFIEDAINQKKQPIVIFGANWCPDARLLEGVLQLPTVQNFLENRCEILNIDLMDYEINTNLFKFFDPSISQGVPRVFIMNLKGRTINLVVNDQMRTARESTLQVTFDYFQNFLK